MNRRHWLLSAVIVAHLGIVLLAPNPRFYITGAFGDWFLPYARSLGMDSSWQFFSPYPWHADYYEYDATDAEGRSTRHTFPELTSPYWLRSRYNRRIALMRAIPKDARNLKDVLVSYLCGVHPDAVKLRIRAVSMDFPTLDDVRRGHRLNDLTDPARRRSEDKGEHSCRE